MSEIDVGGVLFDREKIETLIREHTRMNTEAAQAIRQLMVLNKQLERQYDELKDHYERLQGTCQNTFEKWQNSMAREVELEKRLREVTNGETH